jgi:cobalt-zinc-cadmium efflux system membrane fusion protein
MSLPEAHTLSQHARAWATRNRSTLAGAACVVAMLLISMGGRALHLFGVGANASEQPPAANSSSFRLTDDQLRSMTIEPIVAMPFHSEEITDGKIAYDADTLTAVYSPYSGRVTRLVAALGAVVKRGQPLFEIEASEYAQAQSDLLSAAAQSKLSSASEQRRHAQFDAHGGSLQDWQQSQSDLAAAQANLASVRNRLRILGKSDAEIDAIIQSGHPQAQVAAVSPINGVVVDRQIGPGQFLQAGGPTAVYTIADLSSVWLVANVRETEATRVHVGQSVSVKVLALPERTFNGQLSYVAASVDPASRRIPVHALLDNSEHLLKPEMFASFTIATSTDTVAAAIPQEAVIFEGAQARAWVMQSDHDAAVRQLTLGRAHDGKYEVLRGLSAGERVITRGALFIDRAASGG